MDYIGKKCPFCQNRIEESEEVVICGKCKTPHHKVCWKANHGCTTYGCYGEMLTPQDFEEPVFYKTSNNLQLENSDNIEINKADGSQYASFFGGSEVEGAIFKGVRINKPNSNNTKNENSSKLDGIFPQVSKEDIERELREKLKEEIKQELQNEIKAKPMTALICERCGASLPIKANEGKFVCPSCLTEYILNNEKGEKVLTEIHFDNPFLTKIVDKEFLEIKEYIDSKQDFSQCYKKLVVMEKNHSHKFGYWILRLRAFTDDFEKNYNDYKSYDEILTCIKEHKRLFPFEEEEILFINEYFIKNQHALELILKDLKAESEIEEEEIKSLKNEEHKRLEEIKALCNIINNPKLLREKTKYDDETNTYMAHKICIIATLAMPLVIVLCIITIIFIPCVLLLFILHICVGSGIIVFHNKMKELEEEYKNCTIQHISKLEQMNISDRIEIDKHRENCVRNFYEFKHISRILSYDIGNL